ncbi:ankyrin repeat and SOCS box protein 13 [Python bivittatus]|uniref:Ankyrin repeat and SOCS box protein 13 n=1 Tax=Python bivittatus TaxID=176946 RepID=A0A9F5J2Z3_PYTBI|nr:ankyrin repeat and SOCS box protein 13 [Python bivittatus]
MLLDLSGGLGPWEARSRGAFKNLHETQTEQVTSWFALDTELCNPGSNRGAVLHSAQWLGFNSPPQLPAGFWAERTPVHEAARSGEIHQLQELIRNGACVNLVTYDSITPLHEASLGGQTRCVEILLAAGAQVDARNIDGSTPLCDACASGSIDCVKVLLSHGAKVNPPLYTASPLHEACLNGSAECVRLLIKVGANLEAHDCHFGTPLHVACAREHLDCVKLLLNAGANVNAAKLHETALHHAAKVRNADLVEMLIEFGGNVYARDNQGKKPSDYSRKNSLTAECFAYYERTPLRLSQLCRLSLRQALGPKALEKIAHLHIPARLIEFLSYNQ